MEVKKNNNDNTNDSNNHDINQQNENNKTLNFCLITLLLLH